MGGICSTPAVWHNSRGVTVSSGWRVRVTVWHFVTRAYLFAPTSHQTQVIGSESSGYFTDARATTCPQVTLTPSRKCLIDTE